MHSEPITRSPSSLSFTRSTPCVDGCCGPMFRTSSSAPKSVCGFSPAPVMVLLAMPVTAWSSLPAFNAQVLLYPADILLDDVVVLAERIALPLVGQKDARQIGMSSKNDPKHVKRFALQPIGGRPNSGNARDRFAIASPSLHPQALILCEGIKVEHHVKALFALGPIHGRQVGKQVELFFVTQVLCDIPQPPAFHDHNRLLAVFDRFYQRRSKLGANPPDQLIVQRRLQLHGRFRWRRHGRFRRCSSRRCCGGGLRWRSGWGSGAARGLVARGHAGRLLFLGFVGHRPRLLAAPDACARCSAKIRAPLSSNKGPNLK